MKIHYPLTFFVPLSLAASITIHAEDDTKLTTNTVPTIAPPSGIEEEVWVTGGKDAIRTLSGSASLIDEESLATFDNIDLTDVLSQAPGIYIRYEDGYGLRPNIGIRGVTSDRSQKITLMEDGILITPAPYSAPAAYYVPNVNRMSGVEVFKGPSAIQYGPHTVGGAINLITPSVPDQQEGQLDISVGSDNFRKVKAGYGNKHEQIAYWVEGLTYGADGFKTLDGGGNTGFTRNDINAKIRWETPASAQWFQQFDLKLGYANEDSNETYLGLSDADFNATPNRRYRASQHDRFESSHSQVHGLYTIDFNNKWKIISKAYLNRFDRSWNKFDGFVNGPNTALILADTQNSYEPWRAILRGERDSNTLATIGELIDITNNDRAYGSQGLEVAARYEFSNKALTHNVKFGGRFHHDYVERDHQPRTYAMQAGELILHNSDETLPKKAFNEAHSNALAFFINDRISVNRWIIDIGLRHESIDGELQDKNANQTTTSTQSVTMPGLGAFYQWSNSIGFLAGVNKGFSPKGPSASDDVEPEESTNYEYGLRFNQNNFNVDAIGFFSDYQNLLGRCRASDTGCNVGDEFNGGAVQVAGLELNSHYMVMLNSHLTLPVNFTYTFTESAFQTTFATNFSQWRPLNSDTFTTVVNKGDELPYIPEHQANLTIGLEAHNWSIDLAVKHTGSMREYPGRGTQEPGGYTNAYTLLDFASTYTFANQWVAQFIIQNLNNEQTVASRRPFGARPIQGRTIKLGIRYDF